jgi:hypothetical protein
MYGMRHLRLIHGNARSAGRNEVRGFQRVPEEQEERFRYPAEEVWEVSCSDEDQPTPAPTSESRRAS